MIQAATRHCPGSRCRWRPISPEYSPQGTCAAGRSNAAQRPSARDRWPWRSSTAGWRRWAVTDQQVATNPAAAVAAEFTGLASDQRIAKAAAALERNGVRPLLAATGAHATGLAGSLLHRRAGEIQDTHQALPAS